uniref:EGF-like domain-containing protein n=2 Tax=Photinus pyralis TaxID=7054 RepID=A0A1Y1JW37_PHOPY
MFKKMFLVLLASLLLTNCAAQILECSKNEDCQVPTAVCEQNLCKCPVGSVLSTDVTKCLPVSLGLHAVCEDRRQCGWLLGDYDCIDKKCECAKGWIYAMGQCVKKAALNNKCARDRDCFNGYDLLAMTCKGGKCVCNDGYYLRGDFDCRPAITTVGEYCSLNSDCRFENGVCRSSKCANGLEPAQKKNVTGRTLELDIQHLDVNRLEINLPCDKCTTVPNAMCHPAFKKCHCKRGFTYNTDKKKCVAELGVAVGCKDDSQCEIPNSRCVAGKCYCWKTYFTLAGTVACQKPMTHDNWFCNNDERCYVLGPHSKCEQHKCKCTMFPKPNAAFVCEAPEGCVDNSDCDKIKNSQCIAGTCKCAPGYRVEDKSCVPNLGSQCLQDSKCTIANASCNSENLCTCNEEFIANGETACLPLVGLDSECQIKEQCSSATPDSDCVQSKCTCNKQFVPLHGKCIFQRKMGDVCTAVAQCHRFLGRNVVCRNGYCDCPGNMTRNAESTDCESSANTIAIPAFIAILVIALLKV